MTNQIICQLNPDVPPTGSDLGIVNAARKSFGRRSEWDDVSYSAMTSLMHTEGVNITDYRFEGYGKSGYYRRLKPKDKRLLEFLIRGMKADDFELLCDDMDGAISEVNREDMKELLWKWRNTPSHDTPVNHGFFSFEVKAPIFVARHLVKHEYLIMSEYSRRYITDDVEFYEHTYRSKAEDIKQGSSGTHYNSGEWQAEIESANIRALERYRLMVADGVAPEQARGHLPLDLMA